MSTVAAGESVQRELAAIVGEQNVQQENARFAINGVVPATVVSPASP
jgi:hypothetical protein